LSGGEPVCYTTDPMRIRLRPRLINRKDRDPGLLLDLEGSRDCFLVDCGSNDSIPKADLLRISNIFVTHTHIDHFCGFDRILRNILGHVVEISIFGPPGITENVMGKLSGYTWNLIDEEGPIFLVHELDGPRMTSVRLRCRKGFRADGPTTCREILEGIVLEDGRVTVRYVALDHQIESLAYCFQEEPFASIRAERLRELGLLEGPWLAALQERVLAGPITDEPFPTCGRDLTLSELTRALVDVKPGRKITYVADTVFSPKTCESVSELARGSDDLFCEANYQEADADKAGAYFHLTARQAATLARMAQVKRLVLFHISRKYQGDIQTSIKEASELFERVE
jgi:ribonuclease Z